MGVVLLTADGVVVIRQLSYRHDWEVMIGAEPLSMHRTASQPERRGVYMWTNGISVDRVAG